MAKICVSLDLADSLTENLNRIGITHSKSAKAKNADSHCWLDGDECLGSFDAHEGWAILHHYEQLGRIDLAIKAFASTEYAA